MTSGVYEYSLRSILAVSPRGRRVLFWNQIFSNLLSGTPINILVHGHVMDSKPWKPRNSTWRLMVNSENASVSYDSAAEKCNPKIGHLISKVCGSALLHARPCF